MARKHNETVQGPDYDPARSVADDVDLMRQRIGALVDMQRLPADWTFTVHLEPGDEDDDEPDWVLIVGRCPDDAGEVVETWDAGGLVLRPGAADFDNTLVEVFEAFNRRVFVDGVLVETKYAGNVSVGWTNSEDEE